MKRLPLLLLTLAFLYLGACAHSIHDVYVSDYTPGTPFANTKMISVKTSQMEVLNLATDTQFVDQAYQELQDRCPLGSITGITTQFSTSLGFFSWTNKMTMKGYCVNENERKNKALN